MRAPLLLILLAFVGCKDDAPTPDSGLPSGDSAPGDSAPEEDPDADGDGVPASEDCDDADPSAYPGAAEVCDGVDNDCDGLADDDAADATAWSVDTDGDGYGAGEPVLACAPPEGHVAQAGDCDDTRADIHPGAAEPDCADPTDYNCDGSVGYADADGDGHAACEDCDDTDAGVHPDAAEVCDDRDNNCDGSVDEGLRGTFYQDADGDGYGDPDFGTLACTAPEGYVADATDCDDSDAAVSPAAQEVCGGGDEDCDGLLDDADPSLDPATQAAGWTDADGDGYGDPDAPLLACTLPSGVVSNDGDCDDGDAAVSPSGQEVCGGGDEDCDGLLDDDDPSVDLATASSAFEDADGDGYGGAALTACTLPADAVADSSDCDDADAAVYPGAAEQCDGLDNDCDGQDDTLGYWPFEEGSGTTTADVAGLGLSGVITAGTWTTGAVGGAIELDGSTSHITVTPTGSELVPTGGLTVSVWARPDSLRASSWDAVVSLGSMGTSSCCVDTYFLGYYLRGLSWYNDGATTNYALFTSATYSAHIGSWHHLVGTWSPDGTQAIYVDGALAASGTKGPKALTSDGSPLRIGADTNTGSPVLFFDGAVDEVKVFSCALDAGEVAADYGGGWPW